MTDGWTDARKEVGCKIRKECRGSAGRWGYDDIGAESITILFYCLPIWLLAFVSGLCTDEAEVKILELVVSGTLWYNGWGTANIYHEVL